MRDVVISQHELRRELRLRAEGVSLSAFIAMIGEEIGLSLAAGRTMEQVSQIVTKAIGRTVAPQDLLERFYNPSQNRRTSRT